MATRMTTVLIVAIATPRAPSARTEPTTLEPRPQGSIRGSPGWKSAMPGPPEDTSGSRQLPKTGTLPTFVFLDNHSVVIACSVPSDFSSAIAWLTQGVSELSFCNAMDT